MFNLDMQVDVWAFVKPFNYEVWVFSLISMPVLVLAMGLSDLLIFHQVDWDTITSFVVRHSLIQSPPVIPDRKLYNKVFVLVWLWTVLILTRSYAGNKCTNTEGEIKVCTWLREIPSCSCFTVLPGPAWVLLSKTNKPLFPPL